MTDYPEHEKLEKVQAETQVAGEFIDWLAGRTPNVVLMTWMETRSGNHFWTSPDKSLQDLLAEWAGIDPVKLEQEKRTMLERLRKRLETGNAQGV